jgi:hypothetical protein
MLMPGVNIAWYTLYCTLRESSSTEQEVTGNVNLS